MSEKGLEILSKRLKEVRDGFDAIRNAGIGEDLLISYLCHKMKISEKAAKKIVKTTNQFFEDLIGKEVAESL